MPERTRIGNGANAVPAVGMSISRNEGYFERNSSVETYQVYSIRMFGLLLLAAEFYDDEGAVPSYGSGCISPSEVSPGEMNSTAGLSIRP